MKPNQSQHPISTEATLSQLMPEKPKNNKRGLIIALVVIGVSMLVGIILVGVAIFKIANEAKNHNTTASVDAPKQTNAAISEQCLKSQDFNMFVKDMYGIEATVEDDYIEVPFSTNVFFLNDSLEYDFGGLNFYEKGFRAIANFTKLNSDKKFKIRLTGSVATNNASDKDFASQRAEKVKTDIVSLGADPSVFVIEQPRTLNDFSFTDPDAMDREVARNVDIVIDPTCQ